MHTIIINLCNKGKVPYYKNYIFKITAIMLFVFLTNCIFAQSTTNLEDLFNRNIENEERENIKNSIFELSQEIRSNPDNYILYTKRGIMYAKLGLHPDAISDYNKSISLKDDYSIVYYNRGISRARFGYTKVACTDIKKAADLGLSHAENLYIAKCGLFFTDLGEIKK